MSSTPNPYITESAIINHSGRVVWLAWVPEKMRRITVAGDIAIDGSPVNTAEYRVSRSRRNIAIARRLDAMPLIYREHGNLSFFLDCPLFDDFR